MSDPIYFIAAKKTKAAAHIKEWQASHTRHRNAIAAFCEKHHIKAQSVSSGNGVVGLYPTENQKWGDFIRSMPEWRRIKSRGCDYIVPRKIHKELAKEWASIPGPQDVEYLGAVLTGLDKWMDWLVGMNRHRMGLSIRKNGSAIVVIDYHITKHKKFALAEGLALAPDQNAIREEWHTRMAN